MLSARMRARWALSHSMHDEGLVNSMQEAMIEQVKQQCAGMTPAEIADAEQLVPRYTTEQVNKAIDYVKAHASRPNWKYLRQVLLAKPRRITYADYQSFDESTKAKIDRFVGRRENVVITGFEIVPPPHLPAWVRHAVYGDD